jgi:hypothetical protein
MSLQWILFIKGILLMAIAFQPMEVKVSTKKEPVTELTKSVRQAKNESYGLVVHQINTNYQLGR